MWFTQPSSLVVLGVLLAVGGPLVFSRSLARSSAWKATVTPLASIMGSGFLVCAPLLYDNVGNWATLAMAGLLALAYAIGSVIRFNIRQAEPLLNAPGPSCAGSPKEHRLHKSHCETGLRVLVQEVASFLEKLSHVVLAGAYVISVSYYLQLLASFALHPLALDAGRPWLANAVVTAILLSIGAVGALRGLAGIEKVERVVIGVNLAMIAALVAGLAWHNGAALAAGTWHLGTHAGQPDPTHTVRLLMGMLIVVQGFETSRYLGSEHSAPERIRTMRLAQIISSCIYLAFLGLMAVVIGGGGQAASGITAIIDLSGSVALVLPLCITLTALGSQFSAATADNAGCAGLLESLLGRWLSPRMDYVVVALAATALTWATDVMQIISIASRAFALYYALQCALAALIALRPDGRSVPRATWYALLALVCAGVTALGIPAG